jgi:hypothetical protein
VLREVRGEGGKANITEIAGFLFYVLTNNFYVNYYEYRKKCMNRRKIKYGDIRAQ